LETALNGRDCCKKEPYTGARSAQTLIFAIQGEEMSNERDAGSPATRAPSRTDLGQQYREIGISAIAAALPYVGAQKNHAYAPATPKIVTIRDLERLLG
jgi:hypothetical protein